MTQRTLEVQKNDNFILPNDFCLVFGAIPSFPIQVQKCNFPGITGGTTIEKPTPFRVTKYPGHGVSFSNISMTFLVDENMTDYMFLYSWINAIHLGTQLFDLRQWIDADTKQLFQSEPTIGGSTNATLIMLTNKKNPNIKVTFDYLFPVSLSDIELETNGDTGYRTATVEFTFNHIKFEKVTEGIDPIFLNPKVKDWLETQRRLGSSVVETVYPAQQ